MAIVQGRAEPRDAVEIGEIERDERGAAAVFSNFVIEFLEAALGSGNRNDMSAEPSQCARCGVADAARGASDESDAVGEGEGHFEHSINVVPVHTWGPIRRDSYDGSRGSCPILFGQRTTTVKTAQAWLRVNSLPPAMTIAEVAARPGSGR